MFRGGASEVDGRQRWKLVENLGEVIDRSNLCRRVWPVDEARSLRAVIGSALKGKA